MLHRPPVAIRPPRITSRLLLLVAAVGLLSTPPVIAGLCPPCRTRSYTKDIGECKECDGMTTSGQFQLCLSCSEKLHQCEHCRTALPETPEAARIDASADGVYQSGRWEYRYTVGNKGTRSEGYYGELLFDGHPVPEPPTLNDYHQTPWGPVYWVGSPVVAFGSHGWMPKPHVRQKIGQELPEPGSAAASAAP